MLRRETVTVNTTGSAGSATGAQSSAAICGLLHAIHFNFHASAPATTDTTVAYDEPDFGNIVVLTNTVADVLHLPRKQASDAAGAAIAGIYDRLPICGAISFALAQCDALTGALVATIYYEA